MCTHHLDNTNADKLSLPKGKTIHQNITIRMTTWLFLAAIAKLHLIIKHQGGCLNLTKFLGTNICDKARNRL